MISQPRLSRAIKILLTAAVLGLLLSKIDPAKVLDAFAHLQLSWLILALLLSAAMVAVRWLNWHLLVCAALGQTAAGETFASLLGGMAIALVTPARVGDLSRVAFLSTRQRAEASGLVLVDRFIDLTAVLIFGTIGMTVVFGTAQLPLLILILIALLVGVYKLDLFLQLGARLIPIKKVQQLIGSAMVGFRRLSLRTLSINLALTILLDILDIISLYVLVRALGVDNLRAVIFVYPLVMLTNLIPITISGLGVRESTSVSLFALFKISQAVAFNATFLAYLINSLAPALFGIYFFRRLNQQQTAGAEVASSQ